MRLLTVMRLGLLLFLAYAVVILYLGTRASPGRLHPLTTTLLLFAGVAGLVWYQWRRYRSFFKDRS